MIERYYRGPSMTGTFRPGDLLFIEPVQLADVRLGDIVAFNPPEPGPEGVDTVHRVVAVGRQGLICRGDNNRFPDGTPVTEERLVGRVVRFAREGRTRAVRGGRPGLRRAHRRWTRNAALRALAAPARPLYRRLRTSGLIGLLWKPDIREIRFCSTGGDYIKYIHRGRTVASWRPDEKAPSIRKPYDLILWKRLAREGAEGERGGRGPQK